jgi:hypothetical protein
MSILKMKLDEVSIRVACYGPKTDIGMQVLKETQNNESSSSDE